MAALVPLAIALGLISARTEDRIIEELRGIARQVAGELRQGYAPRPVPSELVDVQVVDARGQVVTASAGLAGRPPMTTVRPSRPDVPERLHLCDPPITAGECLHVVALAVDVPGEVRVTGGGTVPGGRWVVYTATRRRHYPPPYAEAARHGHPADGRAQRVAHLPGDRPGAAAGAGDPVRSWPRSPPPTWAGG